jgi:hypothetical protein
MVAHIKRPPNPEYLIKSIAEQGYSLETAFADLIDNSISANATIIEILSNTTNGTKIFISDNGEGMTEEKLIESLSIPSSSIDNIRNKNDLGRFGLGLKTASFSQTRNLIVLSKTIDSNLYSGYSWDLEILKSTNDWTLKKLNKDEINQIIQTYKETSDKHLKKFINFNPNTIILWNGLYKYEKYLEDSNRISALNSDLTENVEEHLSISFHRFIERGLNIRLNNKIIKSFNPFPNLDTIISLPKRRAEIKGSVVKIESIVLPNCAVNESKMALNNWTTERKSLMDMEGLYIYRGDRLISYGGWHGITKRNGKMQLGRMKIDIGNEIDNILKLNVAKSQIEIPFELNLEFKEAINYLITNAAKEFYNSSIKELTIESSENKNQTIFHKKYTSNGALVYVNENHPLIQTMNESFDEVQKKLLNILVKNFNVAFNKNRNFDKNVIISEDLHPISSQEIEKIKEIISELNLDDSLIRNMHNREQN